MPSAFSSSSGSALGVGWSGRASGSSATASGTKPGGSESASASLSPGLSWGTTALPLLSGLTWRAEVRRGSTCRQLSGGGQ
eukprot:2908382-Amphidinium_carterae.1